MAEHIDTQLKTVKVQNHSFKLAQFDETTWVALRSLTDFLNLNYEKQVRTIAGDTSVASLGASGSIRANAKLLIDPDGVKDMWIPMGEVSLYVNRITMEDLTKIERQTLCANVLPRLMAKVF